ncbi:hypothetical protein [Flavobacterium sp. I3-2]|uniref:hypothetical protein n=1 Tax=Flavobacterium sp. I3-2 TaxID=2748319 RepID=UPI0015AB1A54|nr:hypothetical protein [Flavobacterium sp. I3-2]
MDKSISLLNTELTNKALLDQLILQLNKDFYRATQEEVVPSNASVFEIVANLEIQLKVIVDQHPNKLSTLLYLIDIPEHEVHKNLKENPDQMIEVLCYLILKRECQKVYFRNKL